MSKVYIAKQSIGEVRTGGEVKGLTEKRAKFLLEKGAIVEVDGDDANTGEGGEAVELDTLTNKELKALLDEEGIEYNASDDKKALIARFPKG